MMVCCLYMCVFVYVHVCVCIRVRVCMCVYVYVYVYVHVYVYIVKGSTEHFEIRWWCLETMHDHVCACIFV